jgi:hypothetical protein
MDEILDLWGQPAPVDPDPVPPVVYHECEQRRRVVGESRACAHCSMNRWRWRRRPGSIPQWRSKADVVTHHAVVVITKVDGSTLELCGQHVREYDKRGD